MPIYASVSVIPKLAKNMDSCELSTISESIEFEPYKRQCVYSRHPGRYGARSKSRCGSAKIAVFLWLWLKDLHNKASTVETRYNRRFRRRRASRPRATFISISHKHQSTLSRRSKDVSRYYKSKITETHNPIFEICFFYFWLFLIITLLLTVYHLQLFCPCRLSEWVVR